MKNKLKDMPRTYYFGINIDQQLIPGHALHAKGLQRQIGVVTLVSSQERRALLVPRLNRGSTAGQPVVLFLRRLYVRIRLFVLPKRRSEQLSSVLWWARGTDLSWASRTFDVPSGRASLALPPRCAPPRPDPPVVCPGFGLGRFG